MNKYIFKSFHTPIDLLWELHWYAPRTAIWLHRLDVLMRACDVERPEKESRRNAVIQASRQLAP